MPSLKFSRACTPPPRPPTGSVLCITGSSSGGRDEGAWDEAASRRHDQERSRRAGAARRFSRHLCVPNSFEKTQDDTLHQKKIERWLALDPALRTQVKQAVRRLPSSQLRPPLFLLDFYYMYMFAAVAERIGRRRHPASQSGRAGLLLGCCVYGHARCSFICCVCM